MEFYYQENITAYHAAIKPNLIKDKKKFLVKVKISFTRN